MADRPSGTVTFLFTDVEGSTRLLRELGAERYQRALEDHRRVVREAIAAQRGFEVDTQGDSFLVAFGRAAEAAGAAAAIQRELTSHPWPADGEVRVRIGLHTTEAIPGAEGYVGIGVHRGARICAAAHGGQVVMSQVTADLIGEEGPGIRLLDLGEHRLKDLVAGGRLFQLAVDGLPDRFPPLRSLDHHPTNLPVQPTALIGRRAELEDLLALLAPAEVRLVTLTGTGGAGKTRLALQAAADLLDDVPDGVFLVDLSGITDAEVVLPAIGQALGVNEGAGQSLAAFLSSKRLLLVLDNFEQVLDAGPALAALLAGAPGCRAIVTSREPLHLAGERVFPVAPLPVDDAVALFFERARSIVPDFRVGEDRATVERICARLDGLPLAIELAAARVGILSPGAVLERLDQRLALLTSGARDLPARQRTLRGTLEWSHDLLADDERRAFAGLGVFVGGFSLEAAERVCDASLDTVGSLVDKSLARREGDRLRLLDTIREFAVERLAASGNADALRDRHAVEYEQIAEEAYAGRHRHQEKMAARLAAEQDNLRVALDHLGGIDPSRLLRLAGALGWFWHVHSDFTEGRTRLADALDRAPDSAAPMDRARALSASVELAAWQGDVAAAERSGADAVAEWRALGREQEVAFVLHDLGWGHFFAGEDGPARDRMEESLRIQRSQGDPLLVNRAQLGLLQVLVSLGELDEVKRLGPEALALSEELGDVWYEHFAHHFLADCALMEGDARAADEGYRRSLGAAWRSGDRVETCYELQGIAMAAAGLSRPALGLTLTAAAERALRELGVEHIVPFWRRLVDEHTARARAAIGTGAADAAWQAGAEMELEEAVTEALA